MKKTIIRVLSSALSLTMIMSSLLLLNSCGKKDFVPEAEGEVYVKPIKNAETAREDPKEGVEEGEYNSRGYWIIGKVKFERGEESYNWNEFYNACLKGDLNPSGDDAVEYINEIRDLFVKYDLTAQIEQADTLLKAVEKAKADASKDAE